MVNLLPGDIDLNDSEIRERYKTQLAYPQGDESVMREYIATMENSRLKNEKATKENPALAPQSVQLETLRKKNKELEARLEKIEAVMEAIDQ